MRLIPPLTIRPLALALALWAFACAGAAGQTDNIKPTPAETLAQARRLANTSHGQDALQLLDTLPQTPPDCRMRAGWPSTTWTG